MEEDFTESDESIPALLRRIGFNGPKKNYLGEIPRLLSSTQNSQINQSTQNKIHFAQSQYSVPGWIDTRWKYRKNISILPSQVFGDFINFPILIELFDGDLRDHAQVSSNDILFTNEQGIKLDHEIEFYDRQYSYTQAHLVAWVKTNLTDLGGAYISMYYGNPTAEVQENPTGVWDTNYVGVWHLSEDPAEMIHDSTSNNNDGTSQGSMNLTDQVEGKIDGSIDFDGDDDYIDCGNDSSLDITGEITLQFWVKAESFANDPDVLAKGRYNESYSSWIKDTGVIYFEFNNDHLISSTSLSTGTWYNIACTREGNTRKIYINGNEDATDSYSNPIDIIVDSLTIARSPDNLDGLLDELRVSKVGRSINWIKTEYANQFNPSSFYIVTSQEKSPVTIDWHIPLFKYRKNISIDCTKVMGTNNLTNFPFLIDLWDIDLHDINNIQDDADDLIFTTISGIKLDHEIEYFDQTGNGSHAHLVTWVRMPSLLGTLNTTISMYYGNNAIRSQENAPGVWMGYTGVWHLNQDPSSTTIKDSTDHGYNLTAGSGFVANDLINGKFGNAIQFEGVSNEYLELTSGFLCPSNDFTMEMWFELHENDSKQYFLRGNGGITDSPGIQFNDTSNTLTTFVEASGSGSTGTYYSNWSPNQWYHYVTTYEGGSIGKVIQYINGSMDSEDYDPEYLGTPVPWTGFALGSDVDHNYPINGAIEEFRIYPGVLSSNWIKTSYNNQYDPDSFYSVGVEEENTQWWADASFTKRRDIVINKDKISDSNPVLDNSQILYLRPTDRGSTTDLSVSGSSVNWEAVDEENSDDGNSYVFQTGGQGNRADTYDIENTPPILETVINSVTIKINARWNGFTSFHNNAATRLVTHSTTYDGVNNELDTSWTVYSTEYTDNPNTGITWTWNEINDMEIGVYLTGGSGISEGQITQVWVEVDYSYIQPLHNFPVLLDITTTDFKQGDIQSDAEDIIFTDKTGSMLDFEIEYFSQNIAEGHLVTWVKTNVSSIDDTIISMYYSNGQIKQAQERVTQVWDSNYVGAWHLQESSGNAQDSTSYGQEGIPTGGVTQGATGQVDGAYYFDGIDCNVSMGDPSDNHLDFGTGSFTVETWIKRDSTMSSTQYGGIFKGNGDVSDSSGWLIRFKGSDSVRFSAGDGTASVFNIHKSSILVDDIWMHFVGVLDRSAGEAYLYKDGQKIATDTATNGNIDSSALFRLCEDWDSSFHFKGLFDEIRLSNIARSSDWIATEYQNQYDPASFYSVGSEAIFDTEPPVINDFGVDDPGTGIGIFWADITDEVGEVSNVSFKVNSDEYTMNFNNTHWIYSLSVEYQGFYEYQIVNASDIYGNYLTNPSDIKNYIFSYDSIAPVVLERYFDHKNTFTTNITDSWGLIDTVIVNVTYHSVTLPSPSHWVMTNFQNFSGRMGYIRDNLSINNGDIKYQIFVNDTEGNYDISGLTESYVYVNHPPVVGNLTLSPSPIYSNSTLVLTYDYYDEETPDYESGTEICWYRNNGSGFQLHSNYLYPADGTVALERDHSDLLPDDQWYATVIPKDGEMFGIMENSSLIVILNTPPNLSNVELKPSDPFTTNVLSIEYTYSDYDGDNETLATRQIEWYKVGSGYIPGFDNQTSLSSDQTSKGDEFYVRIRVNDGTSYSSWVNSSHVLIKNSIPEATNLTITPIDVTTSNSLVASWDMDDVDAEDIENKTAAIIYWYKNGQLQTSWTNSTTIGSGNTSKNEWWHFELQIFDGDIYSDLTESPHIQILNTPPAASTVTITANPLTTDDISASWIFSDADTGDTESADSWIIRWYKDNQLQIDYNNEKLVPASVTSKGEVWNYTLQVFDGTNYSIQYNSSITTILNSPPIVSELTITSIPTTSDDLTVSWTTSDVDGDNPDDYLNVTITNWYNWTGTVWEEFVSASNSTFLGAGNTTKGEVWRFNVRIFDGENYSIEYISMNTTVLNSIPTIINPSFNETTGITTADSINITYTYVDADGDPEDPNERIVYWFVNGNYNISKFNNVTLYSGETKSGEFWQYIIKVYDGTTWSQNFTSSLVVIGSAPNNMPEVQNLTLTANTNTTTENLIFDYDYIDVDGHLQSDRKIYWYKDGLLQLELNDSLVVDASLTSKHELWNCTVQVFDGLNWSIQYNSTSVLILNTAPSVSELSINVNPVTTTDLVANWVGSDDNSDDLTYNITWYFNGIFNSSWETTSTTTILMAGNTTSNDKWYFSVKASDGESFSSIVSLTSNVTILNTAPIAGNLTVTANPTTTDDLVAGWDDYDIDNDLITPLIQWFMNDPGQSVVGLDNKTTIESGNTSKNEVWWFILRVYDGENYSAVYESFHIQIQNSVPINNSGLPLPMDPNKINGIQLVSADILDTLEDDDNDQIELTEIRWYKDSVLQPSLNDSFIVPGSKLTKGDAWSYSILPFDGSDYGSVYTSNEFTILNSPPTITTVYFGETEVRTVHNLTISYQASDADGEALSVSGVKWYLYNYSIMDWDHVTLFDGYSTLPYTTTHKAERWKFGIQLFDGEEFSSWKNVSLSLTIANSIAWIDPFSIVLQGGRNTSDPIYLNYEWFDDDPEDNETGTTIMWSSADSDLPNNEKILDSSFIRAGERWWVTITPNDGEASGEYVNSKLYGVSIIVGNTPPFVNQANITIKGKINATEVSGESIGSSFDLVLYYNASDIDSDENRAAYGLNLVDGYAVGSEYRWYRNRSGVVTQISMLNDRIIVHSDCTKKDDVWWVQVTPRDFYGDYGSPANSTKITIGNTAPQIKNLHWLRSQYYTGNDLSFSYNFYDYDVNDELMSEIIYWYRNGSYIPQFDNYSNIPSCLTNKSEIWYANIMVWDGISHSIWYQLPTIIILNTPPSTTDVLLLPIFPNTTVDLVASWNFTDPDGDPENVSAAIIEWYRNGEYVGNLTIVPSNMTNRGEMWYFTVNVTDMYDYSTSFRSNTITIMNSVPTVTNILINNGSLVILTTNTLVVTWEFNDFDSIDIELDTSIIWYMNGEIQTKFNNQSSIADSDVIKEQEWQVAISVKDTGGLWSETVLSSIVFISNSRPIITIHHTSHPEFIIEDEKLLMTNFFTFADADGDEPSLTIWWYLNGEYNSDYDNHAIISTDFLQPGDIWNYVIRPYDGTEFGANKTSPMIYIESRPLIHHFNAIPLSTKDGLFDLEVSVTDFHNKEITQVEFLLYINSTSEELASFIQTSPKEDLLSIWVYPFDLSNYSYINSFVIVNVTVVSKVTYNKTYQIRRTYIFNFTLEDNAPPRVVNPYWVFDDDLNPTNITFYTNIIEYGSEISEVTLYYYFRHFESTEAPVGIGATLRQVEDSDWRVILMTLHNTTGDIPTYSITVLFDHNGTDREIIYCIETMDSAGNSVIAYDIERDDPARVGETRFTFLSSGIDPTIVMLIIGITLLIAFSGSVVYVKFIRKPELVGLDKELVLKKITEISEEEIKDTLDAHTIGVVVSFFDQRHGPIPIIVIPEILKDNFSKLVDLSDRSFSGTGFSDDFTIEIPSSYDFVLAQGLRASVLSFGYSLERPNARGGQENITCNILVHKEVFPLVNQFQDEIQREIHTLHITMDKEPSNKNKVRREVLELRKYVSAIIISYEDIYGTTELLTPES
ncbi:MAG: DUF2341 domain-containing protein [Candidatus Hodarchaeales archaeon]